MESILLIGETMEKEKSQGDIEFLETIYRQYYKNVYNYISFRINDHFDAEELSSLVFEKAIRGYKGYNANFPMEAWLIGIAKNTIIDYLRKKKHKSFTSLDSIIQLISPSKQPEEVIISNEEHRKLMTAMAKLKDKERQILSMKFATDLKHKEIAEILGISDSRVGVTAHRALKKLKKLIESEGI